jgi:predicted lactoylglutathione lyase
LVRESPESWQPPAAAVVVNYASDRTGAESVVDAIIAAGVRAKAVQADVAKDTDVVRVFERTKETFGSLDILVNNAGVFQAMPVIEKNCVRTCRFPLRPFDYLMECGEVPPIRPNVTISGNDMATKVFVNLPVKDVKNSMRFYESLGYRHNPQFTDETAACIVISDTIYVMLLTYDKFKQFTPRDIADWTRVCEVLLSLSCESRSAVEDLVAKAIAAGGSQAHDPEDYGFMYQSGFYDPDGHGWGLLWMAPAAVEDGQS